MALMPAFAVLPIVVAIAATGSGAQPLQNKASQVASSREPLSDTSGLHPLSSATSSPIQHVVVLYMENHSFDNVLGYWCNNNSGRCPDGGMPASVKLSNGAVVIPSVAPDTVPALSHNVLTQTTAIDGGKMDGWAQIYGCSAKTGYACISGYKPSQIPNLTTLANDFAISDNTFSMGDSPSWGGHLYAALASLDGFLGNIPKPASGVTPGPGWGCNSDQITQWAPSLGAATQWVPSCVPDPSLNSAQFPNGGAFEPTPVSYEPSIFDRLDAAGLSWRIYAGGQTNGWAICPSLAECYYTSQRNNVLGMSHLFTDTAAGNLPNFSIINPGGLYNVDSEHNGFSMTEGDNWLGKVATDIMNSPDWSSTVLFITYDDCGCFYDQVPPGVNPDGTLQGPRTPLLIVSPYARAGYTDTTHTTFAGILAYVENNFGLTPLDQNDANAYAFGNALNYSQTPLKAAPMVKRPLPASAKRIRLTPALLNDPT
jgi:phospholipase C